MVDDSILPDSAMVPIASVASQTTFFERSRLFQSHAVVDLGEALMRHPNGISFKPAGGTATIRNYLLQDVVLDADTLMLLKDRRAIAETAYFVPPQDTEQRPEPNLETPLDDNEVLIVGYNNPHWGYQHWLTQCLPAIDWSMRQTRTWDVRLLLPPLQPWQQEGLELLGYAGVPRLTPRAGALYYLPRVEFNEFLNGSTSFEISLALTGTIQRILDAVPSRPSAARLLYIRNAQPYYGVMRNEAAAIKLLRQHGVSIIEPEGLGLADRVNLFRHADAVIGPLGQYLADVVFCRPGTLLWEWMPRHHQNHSFNRLAQTTRVDYWGDLFEDAADPLSVGEWEVDLGVLSKRLGRLAGRGNAVGAASPVFESNDSGPPLEELMPRFESLGDTCEFGFVQRAAGAEPLGLLRFNGFFTPVEFRLAKLVAALERRFEGLGDPGTVTVVAEGLPDRRELMVHESTYELHYHTGVAEGEAEPEVQVEREITRLRFLRRKLLEDLESGHKICVWKCDATTRPEHVRPLLETLRRIGPNALLWVTLADPDHPAGTVELLEVDFIKGYVERFAPWFHAADIHTPSWFEVCIRAHAMRAEASELAGIGDPPEQNLADWPAANPTANPTGNLAGWPVGNAADRRAPRISSLAEAAESWVVIEQQRKLDRQSVVSLGDALARQPNSMAFAPLTTTITARNFTLRDVVLDADTLLLLKDGEVIPETDYFAPPFDPARQVDESTPLGENEVLIFGTNNQHWGYQHWLTQCLPAIDWSMRQTRTQSARLLLPELLPWQSELLSLLGYADVPRLVPAGGARYRLPRVEFSEFITGVNSFGISRTLLATIQRILKATPSSPSADKVLYIRNSSPYFGAIRNEAAIIEMLRQRGVAVVDRDRLSAVERINLFRHADVVIGSVGPHLADVLFCRPGALLWEWMPAHYQNHAYNCLAQAAQVDYWGDLFETAADPIHPGDWEVDAAIVTQRLAALSTRLAVQASRPSAGRSLMVLEPEKRTEAPPEPLSAMERLARGQPARTPLTPPKKPEAQSVPRFLQWFRRR